MNSEKVNILMVDDRPENLVALGAILEPLGQNLVSASSGMEALKCLLKDEFAVILLDVRMPGMDGFETAQIIKSRERTRHVPIIFVTAISKDQRYVFQGYQSGAVDYISKPFEPEILKSKVLVFVDLFRQKCQIEEQAERLRQAEAREKERQLQESEARFHLLMENLSDYAILMLDLEGRITDWSAGAQRIFGLDKEEILGQDGALIFTPEDIEDGVPQLEMQVARDEGRALDERWHIKESGARFWASGIMTGLRDTHGELRGYAKVLRDTTQQKQTEDALIRAKESAERARHVAEKARLAAEEERQRTEAERQSAEAARHEAERAKEDAEAAKDEAERANRAKSEFISGVSHELRTPLNAVIGFSKLLLNPRVGPLNENQEAYTRDIVQGAEHLLQLINDILDLSKIEAGKLSLDVAPFSLPETLEQSLMIVREKAHQHNLALKVEVAPEVESLGLVSADQRKVKQIMFNLLSNAVKFTPDNGSVTVRAELNKNLHQIEVSVQDTGIGIAPEHQERIFGAFEQVDSSYARQQQGTGLGLALTRRLVELHGGCIWLHSAPGEGSTFTWSLPLSKDEGATMQDKNAPEDQKPKSKAQKPKKEKVAA